MEHVSETVEFRLLLEAWSAGDDAARNRLLERAGQRLMNLTRRMLRNYPHLRRWEQTDDVFQNALVRLYQALGDVRPESVGAFFGLAAIQIRRSLIDLARHHFGPKGDAARHQSGAGGQDWIAEYCDARLAGANEPPETLEGWARFHEAVERLPAEERDVFGLIWYEDTSQKDVADVLGVSERTVLRRLVRARLMLHESLKDARSCFEETN